jgi:hypothetical protein
MQAGLAVAIERKLDRAASALLALSCGFAAFAWLSTIAPRSAAFAGAAASAGLWFMLALRLLEAVEPAARRLPVSIFDVRGLDPFDVPELLLTERFEPAGPSEEPLLLDDILGEIGPDSRVVRLFDPAAMPTPGQLDARIRNRLGRDPRAGEDASAALHEALAELRRSLG